MDPKESTTDDLSPERDVVALEREIGARPGLLLSLLDENQDDWSFVVKVHALCEAALSHLLAEACGRPQLLDIFARLELSNSKTGKLAFAEALDLLDSAERGFVRKLSELRNQLVHDVRNTNFKFEAWVACLDKNQFAEARRAFGPQDDDITIAGVTVPSAQFFKENPRLCVWLRCLLTLSLVYRRRSLARTKNEFLSMLEQAALRRWKDSTEGRS